MSRISPTACASLSCDGSVRMSHMASTDVSLVDHVQFDFVFFHPLEIVTLTHRIEPIESRMQTLLRRIFDDLVRFQCLHTSGRFLQFRHPNHRQASVPLARSLGPKRRSIRFHQCDDKRHRRVLYIRNDRRWTKGEHRKTKHFKLKNNFVKSVEMFEFRLSSYSHSPYSKMGIFLTEENS